MKATSMLAKKLLESRRATFCVFTLLRVCCVKISNILTVLVSFSDQYNVVFAKQQWLKENIFFISFSFCFSNSKPQKPIPIMPEHNETRSFYRLVFSFFTKIQCFAYQLYDICCWNSYHEAKHMRFIYLHEYLCISFHLALKNKKNLVSNELVYQNCFSLLVSLGWKKTEKRLCFSHNMQRT